MDKLKDFTDDELQKELERRRKNRLVKQDKERKEYLGEPSPENYMKARYPDLDRPYFKPFYKWFEENYSYKKGLGDWGGYWPDTGQPGIKLMMYRDVPLEEQLGILDFLPYIAEGPDEVQGEGRDYYPLLGKRIEIFERTLSRFYNHKLVVLDLKTLVIRGRTVVKECETVEEALDYVRQHFWYQLKPGVDGPRDGEYDDE